jgi:hypothetical protein
VSLDEPKIGKPILIDIEDIHAADTSLNDVVRM